MSLFTDNEVAKLQLHQDNIGAFRCSNGNCHDDQRRAPVLVVTSNGLLCPDVNCANVLTNVPAYAIS